jgi:hypothetical protein
MDRWISRFRVTLFIVLMLMLGLVPTAFAQEPTADLALTKTADRKNVKIGETITFTMPITNPAQSERKFTNTAFIAEPATFDPSPDNNTASLKLHIVGNTH